MLSLGEADGAGSERNWRPLCSGRAESVNAAPGRVKRQGQRRDRECARKRLRRAGASIVMKRPTAARRGRRRPDRRARRPGEPDRRATAGSYAVFASDFRSSMLAMAHLVSTSTASLWAFIAISASSLALLTAASYIDLAFAI